MRAFVCFVVASMAACTATAQSSASAPLTPGTPLIDEIGRPAGTIASSRGDQVVIDTPNGGKVQLPRAAIGAAPLPDSRTFKVEVLSSDLQALAAPQG